MQTILCENHLFGSRLFGFSELHLALLGSSTPLPGQSWGPDGTQNPPKATPKLDQKWFQKGIQFWSALGPILGLVLGPKTGGQGEPIFDVFRSGSRAPFWPYLDFILAPSWPLLGSSWAQLGPSWPHLGPILVSSWPSWPLLSPSWCPLGPVLSFCLSVCLLYRQLI